MREGAAVVHGGGRERGGVHGAGRPARGAQQPAGHGAGLRPRQPRARVPRVRRAAPHARALHARRLRQAGHTRRLQGQHLCLCYYYC